MVTLMNGSVTAPRFLRQNGELSLAKSTGNIGTVRTLPLTSVYLGLIITATYGPNT